MDDGQGGTCFEDAQDFRGLGAVDRIVVQCRKKEQSAEAVKLEEHARILGSAGGRRIDDTEAEQPAPGAPKTSSLRR